MKYGYSKKVNLSMEVTELNIRKSLMDVGFGVLTEIDVQQAMKEKLGESFRPYKILGACNPPIAFKALSEEIEIGLLLPCNIVLWENDDEARFQEIFSDIRAILDEKKPPAVEEKIFCKKCAYYEFCFV